MKQVIHFSLGQEVCPLNHFSWTKLNPLKLPNFQVTLKNMKLRILRES